MSAEAQYDITTMEQLIEVATLENLPTLMTDLALWLAIHIGAKDRADVEVGRVFKWNDDNAPGISAFNISAQEDS